jgi:hypothetical protein
MADIEKPSRGWFWVLAGCVAAGFAFYEWLLFTRWPVLTTWGALGSALGPVAAVFSAAAVFAALRSIELQRQALAGQQREIDRHMTLLDDQRKEFVRSADAHQALSVSQKELAEAQVNANRINRRLVEAQRLQVITSLQSEILRARLTMASLPNAFGNYDATRNDVVERLGRMVKTLELIEQENIDMAKGGH